MKQAPLKWHGGKQYLAPWIIEHAPTKYTHYAEPYLGGGAVLLHLDHKNKSESVNDIDYLLMNFWEVLRDEKMFEQLKRKCEATPFSQELFDIACDELPDWEAGLWEGSPVLEAWLFFIQVRMSRQGLRKDFATLSRSRTRGQKNEQANSWITAIEGLPEIHNRLRGVVIFNTKAADFIKANDSFQTWFYLDPPYPHDTRNTTSEYGENEMSHDDHVELLDQLARIKGQFSLSSYPNALYDEYAELCGWNWVDKEIDNKASSKKVKDKKIERLYMNYS